MEEKIIKLKRLNEERFSFEEKQLEIFEKKKQHLADELRIKSKLGFKVVEPKYEYENEPEYLEHMVNSFKLTVEEEGVAIDFSISQIYNDRKTREEEVEYLEEMKQ